MSFHIEDWYWSGKPVGQIAKIIYGSKRGGLVADPKTDAEYLEFIKRTIVPSPWPVDEDRMVTVQALDVELVRWGLPPTGLAPLTANSHMAHVDLVAYANSKLGDAVSAVPPYIDARLGIAARTITTTAQIDALAWPKP